MNKVLLELHLWKCGLSPMELKKWRSGLMDRIVARIKKRQKENKTIRE